MPAWLWIKPRLACLTWSLSFPKCFPREPCNLPKREYGPHEATSADRVAAGQQATGWIDGKTTSVWAVQVRSRLLA